jgi:hypothetical protein
VMDVSYLWDCSKYRKFVDCMFESCLGNLQDRYEGRSRNPFVSRSNAGFYMTDPKQVEIHRAGVEELLFLPCIILAKRCGQDKCKLKY